MITEKLPKQANFFVCNNNVISDDALNTIEVYHLDIQQTCTKFHLEVLLIQLVNVIFLSKILELKRLIDISHRVSYKLLWTWIFSFYIKFSALPIGSIISVISSYVAIYMETDCAKCC